MECIRATAKLKDGLVYVQDLGTETNDSKGIFGQHRNELWNTDKKNESCGMILWKKARNKETGLEVERLRQ